MVFTAKFNYTTASNEVKSFFVEVDNAKVGSSGKRIVVILDYSGSNSGNFAEQARFGNICLSLGIEVICFGSNAKRFISDGTYVDFQSHIYCGGTHFNLAFEELLETEPVDTIVVFSTDGMPNGGQYRTMLNDALGMVDTFIPISIGTCVKVSVMKEMEKNAKHQNCRDFAPIIALIRGQASALITDVGSLRVGSCIVVPEPEDLKSVVDVDERYVKSNPEVTLSIMAAIAKHVEANDGDKYSFRKMNTLLSTINNKNHYGVQTVIDAIRELGADMGTKNANLGMFSNLQALAGVILNSNQNDTSIADLLVNAAGNNQLLSDAMSGYKYKRSLAKSRMKIKTLFGSTVETVKRSMEVLNANSHKLGGKALIMQCHPAFKEGFGDIIAGVESGPAFQAMAITQNPSSLDWICISAHNYDLKNPKCDKGTVAIVISDDPDVTVAAMTVAFAHSNGGVFSTKAAPLSFINALQDISSPIRSEKLIDMVRMYLHAKYSDSMKTALETPYFFGAFNDETTMRYFPGNSFLAMLYPSICENTSLKMMERCIAPMLHNAGNGSSEYFPISSGIVASRVSVLFDHTFTLELLKMKNIGVSIALSGVTDITKNDFSSKDKDEMFREVVKVLENVNSNWSHELAASPVCDYLTFVKFFSVLPNSAGAIFRALRELIIVRLFDGPCSHVELGKYYPLKVPQKVTPLFKKLLVDEMLPIIQESDLTLDELVTIGSKIGMGCVEESIGDKISTMDIVSYSKELFELFPELCNKFDLDTMTGDEYKGWNDEMKKNWLLFLDMDEIEYVDEKLMYNWLGSGGKVFTKWGMESINKLAKTFVFDSEIIYFKPLGPVDLARLCVIGANYHRALGRINQLFNSPNNYSIIEMSELAELVRKKECDDQDLHNKASSSIYMNIVLTDKMKESVRRRLIYLKDGVSTPVRFLEKMKRRLLRKGHLLFDSSMSIVDIIRERKRLEATKKYGPKLKFHNIVFSCLYLASKHPKLEYESLTVPVSI
jgi:hypothetical protein